MNRRRFLATTGLVGASLAVRPAGGMLLKERKKSHLKLSCNLYSFNAPLRSGAMTLEDVISFCADQNFDAVDPTGYYFPGYPEPPSREYINRIKRLTFTSGLDISGTGVRNDFTVSDLNAVAADIELVRKWIVASAHLGAPLVRVFSGRSVPAGKSEEQTFRQVADALRKVADYGAEYGVMVGLQNHADLITRADQVIRLLDMVDSQWLGVDLDIGSFRTEDPYDDIAKLAPIAVTWQIKENLTISGQEIRTDLDRLFQIIYESGYRGYLPIETLGAGDPEEKVPRFLSEVRTALRRYGDAKSC